MKIYLTFKDFPTKIIETCFIIEILTLRNEYAHSTHSLF